MDAKFVIYKQCYTYSGPEVTSFKFDADIKGWRTDWVGPCKWVQEAHMPKTPGGKGPIPSGNHCITLKQPRSSFGPVIGLLDPKFAYLFAPNMYDQNDTKYACLRLQAKIKKKM
eukprot:50720_1